MKLEPGEAICDQCHDTGLYKEFDIGGLNWHKISLILRKL